jgi:hypothetical protein
MTSRNIFVLNLCLKTGEDGEVPVDPLLEGDLLHPHLKLGPLHHVQPVRQVQGEAARQAPCTPQHRDNWRRVTDRSYLFILFYYTILSRVAFRGLPRVATVSYTQLNRHCLLYTVTIPPQHPPLPLASSA